MVALQTQIENAKRSIKRRHLTWDNDAGHYRYPNNRKVSDRAMLMLIKREIKDLKSNQSWSVDRWLNKQMSFEEFQEFNINELRKYHVNMMRLAKGGIERTAANDYLDVARELRNNQYPWFQRFMQQIKDGEQSENQIRNRLGRYANNVKISYEQGRVNVKLITEPWGRRRLGSCSPHCAECLQYAAQGWMPLSEIVIPGKKCSCRDNCCCSIETSKTRPIVNLSDAWPTIT